MGVVLKTTNLRLEFLKVVYNISMIHKKIKNLILFFWHRRDYDVLQIAFIFLLAALSMVVVVLPPMHKPISFKLPIPYYSIINALLVMISLWLLYYYLFLRLAGQSPFLFSDKKLSYIKALFLGSLWIGWMGEIIHFTADTIGNFMVYDPLDPGWRITHFLDEILGHVLAYFAIFIMTTLGVWLEMNHKNRHLSSKQLYLLVFLAILGGIGWSIDLIEGEMVKALLPLMLIFNVGLTLWEFFHSQKIIQKPWSLFILITNWVAILLVILWGLYWRGFPQLSDLGWI